MESTGSRQGWRPYTSVVILGREVEQKRLSSLLARTGSGEGGTIAIVGDPGMGKTTILEWTGIRASAEHLTVLKAWGRESESDLPFAVLADLLHPLEGRLDSLPDPQRRALQTALALGESAAGDRLAVNTAALRLMGDYVAEAPLLVLIDDYQWLDTATKDVVDFIARRSQTVGVGVVIATRGSLPPEHGGEVVDLAPLSEGSASALVAEIAELSPAATRRILDLAAGNPLALVELPRVLGGFAETADFEGPISVTASLQRAFGSHLQRLSDRCRMALLCVAEEGTGEVAALARVWQELGLSIADLGEAFSSELLTHDGATLKFRHPLLRSVAHLKADPGEVRRVHRTIAATVDDPDRRAWHLAAATTGRDEAVALALEAVADRALARGAAASASAALRRAAGLSEENGSRTRRLTAAARAAHRAGDMMLTASLIDQARAEAGDGPKDPDLLLLEADIRMRRGDSAGAYATLRLEAAQIAKTNPPRAATMLLVASKFRVHRLEATEALIEVEAALQLVPEEKLEVLHHTALAMAQTMAGDERAGRSARTATTEAIAAPHGHIHSLGIGWPLIWLEEYELASAFIRRSVKIQRDGGFLAYLPQALLPLAELEFRTGHWDDARLHATEALHLFEELSQPTEAAFASALLARVEASSGNEASARSQARVGLETEIRSGLKLATAMAHGALGILELGLSNYQTAAEHFEESRLLCDRGGSTEPWLFPVDADLVDALVRLGDRDQAMLIAKSLTTRAEALGRRSAMAVGHRAVGLASDEEDFRDPFETALAIHEGLPNPFELARTHLAYGERLRRAKKREEARRHLRRALEIFEGLGANPWAERSRSELELSGETLEQPRSVAKLTRQERQVARLVGQGATNREAAAALFVNYKTIEYHLGNVYRKLGVRSRTELANALRNETWGGRLETS
ncbi:MAG TPA: AAA family ATPase [Acidimicrobiia bacterium]|nr:AAA family ATPase [Acidimicrobiia bacterium]